METITNLSLKEIIVSTKDTVLDAVGIHHEPHIPKQHEQNQHGVWDTVVEIKDAIQHKIAEWRGVEQPQQGQKKQKQSSGTLGSGPKPSKKMRNWMESLQKVEESHKVPLHPRHEVKEKTGLKELEEGFDRNQPSGEASWSESFQEKFVQIKDATIDNLSQAKDALMQKGSELKEGAQQTASQLQETASQKFEQTMEGAQQTASQLQKTASQKFEKTKEGIQQTASQLQKNASQKFEQTEQKPSSSDAQSSEHSGLISTVSDVIHSTVETGKELLEKAKDGIANLTTGGNTEEQKEHVQPVDNSKVQQPAAQQESTQTAA